MNFPPERDVKTVFAFARMPETSEKREISAKYVQDEIGVAEFVCLARDYMEKTP